MKTQFSVMECTLAKLFDYAGMFPPAELEMRTAVRQYREYRHGAHAWALGSLVVDADSLSALRKEAEDAIYDLPLSMVAKSRNLETIRQYLDEGLRIETVELKAGNRDEIMAVKDSLPAGFMAYIEVPMRLSEPDVLDAISAAGVRAKLRTGGVIAEAFPPAIWLAEMLKALAERGIPFKATAGLHHPLRSWHAFTYQQNSETGMMHGFMNLLCAAALVWLGGEAGEATELLEEQDTHAWRVTEDAVRWGTREWSANQLREVRERFLMSIGSCSFTEPMRDLEALGWL
jgi:hypothetical protein